MIKSFPGLKHEWKIWPKGAADDAHKPGATFCTLCNLEMKAGARWEEYDEIWKSECKYKIRNPQKKEAIKMEPCCDCPCCAEKPCGTKCCDKH